MNLLMHGVMAREMLRRLEYDWNININSAAFIAGSFYPDMSHKIFVKRHFAEDSLDATRQDITSLCGGEHDISSAAFAFRLGEVLHYVCDYLCYSHNSAFKGTFPQHVRYEKYQRRQWRWITSQDTGDTSEWDDSVADSRTPSDILSYLDNQLAIYVRSLERCREEQLDDIPRAIALSTYIAAAICRMGMADMPVPSSSPSLSMREARRILGVPDTI
ncbi:MAG: zinc dependent phospholipase C family protein [Eubacteriales bacterium]